MLALVARVLLTLDACSASTLLEGLVMRKLIFAVSGQPMPGMRATHGYAAPAQMTPKIETTLIALQSSAEPSKVDLTK